MTSPAGAAGFRKARRGAPPGLFGWEAAGLRWLAVDGGPPVVEVHDVGPEHLDLTRIEPARADAAAAREFGAALARLHDAGAPGWGVGPPGWTGPGFFGPIHDPLPLALGDWPDWATFYAEARLRPILRQGRQRRSWSALEERLLDDVIAALPRLAGPALDDVPARLHGDLWSGNVLWSRQAGAGAVRAWLIDPAAHGGHRETDLAMLDLFGAPYLSEIVAGYQYVHSLAPGWEGRLALHQLYPVAVHVVLFGGGYAGQLRGLIRGLLK